VFIGDIENSGSIFGAEDGIEIDAGVAFHGSILNAETGVITGGVNGIEVNNVLEGPTIENHGTIQSDSRAVNIDGMGTELLNTGTIVGTDDQRDGTVYANSTADDYEIENEGVIDAGEGNNGSGVSLQTGDVDGDVVMASLENAGTIEGRGDATSGNTIGDGVRLFSDVSDAVWQGDIENDGLIMGSEDTDVAVGIRIEDGVTLDGEIVNTGTIVGTEIAIDASDAGGSVEIVNDGEIIGDVVLSAGDDVFDGSGGTVDGVVFGNGGDDVLIGGAFDDILAGGAGDDELTGGSGMDIFVVTPADAPSFDTITDFELGMDLIDATAFASVTVALDEDDTILTFALDNQVRLVDVDLTALVTDDYLV